MRNNIFLATTFASFIGVGLKRELSAMGLKEMHKNLNQDCSLQRRALEQELENIYNAHPSLCPKVKPKSVQSRRELCFVLMQDLKMGLAMRITKQKTTQNTLPKK